MEEVVELIQAGRIVQDRKISNEMLQHYSPERLKIELGRYKKESLSILSTQITDRVSEKETPDPAAHTIEYSGYFINEEEFNKIKELLGWTEPQKDQSDPATKPDPTQEPKLQTTLQKPELASSTESNLPQPTDLV